MDGMLHILNAWRESKEFPLWLPYLRVAAMVVAGFSVGLISTVVQVDDVLTAVRDALRDIGISDKDACTFLGVNRGNLCDKLRGERPFTLQAASKFPIEFWQAFSVRLAMRVGSPAHVMAGMRLARDARRQSRMSLAQRKAGLA